MANFIKRENLILQRIFQVYTISPLDVLLRRTLTGILTMLRIKHKI